MPISAPPLDSVGSSSVILARPTADPLVVFAASIELILLPRLTSDVGPSPGGPVRKPPACAAPVSTVNHLACGYAVTSSEHQIALGTEEGLIVAGGIGRPVHSGPLKVFHRNRVVPFTGEERSCRRRSGNVRLWVVVVVVVVCWVHA